ncbi:MAG: hypothetical protein M9939_26555 [Mesorhizobium sp.]|nr:hypothetical protein [Mesorhizobium sp.]MCO5164655.1 hypothetical protein [Mesorhizobium sp.]
MALFDPPWAVDGGITVPDVAQIRRGFECGDADPYLFNYLFQTIESAINALDTEGMVPLLRQINTTEGIQGGGSLGSNRTFRLDVNGLQERTSIANGNFLVIYDTGTNQHYKITRANVVAGLGGEGGTLTGAENIGDGPGEIFSALDDDMIQLRTIDHGDGLDVSTVGDKVIVAFGSLPAELTVE